MSQSQFREILFCIYMYHACCLVGIVVIRSHIQTPNTLIVSPSSSWNSLDEMEPS